MSLAGYALAVQGWELHHSGLGQGETVRRRAYVAEAGVSEVVTGDVRRVGACWDYEVGQDVWVAGKDGQRGRECQQHQQQGVGVGCH